MSATGGFLVLIRRGREPDVRRFLRRTLLAWVLSVAAGACAGIWAAP